MAASHGGRPPPGRNVRCAPLLPHTCGRGLGLGVCGHMPDAGAFMGRSAAHSPDAGPSIGSWRLAVPRGPLFFPPIRLAVRQNAATQSGPFAFSGRSGARSGRRTGPDGLTQAIPVSVDVADMYVGKCVPVEDSHAGRPALTARTVRRTPACRGPQMGQRGTATRRSAAPRTPHATARLKEAPRAWTATIAQRGHHDGTP